MPIEKIIKYEDPILVAKGKKNKVEELLEMEDWLNTLDPKYWLEDEDDKQTAPSEDSETRKVIIYKKYVDRGGQLNFPDFLELLQGTLKRKS